MSEAAKTRLAGRLPAPLFGVCLALLVGLALVPATARAVPPPAGRAMWVWYLSRSDGGNLAALAAQAHAEGVGSVFVKSADGTNVWAQFTPALVATLHADGLHVCAWQYVYGSDPYGEAQAALSAIRDDGADCLIIDAEAEYEGRYAAAQEYLHTIRAAVGPGYPLALAPFPFADEHPSFPYSVFLGPGGAQFDLPQMYWNLIGESPAAVFRRTYTDLRIYRRMILPVGQTFGPVSAFDVEIFRGLAVRYGAPGISWWDFAWTSADTLWPAVGAPWMSPGAVAPLGYPRLGVGNSGDDVLWLQEHLATVYRAQRLTGLFGDETERYLDAFQAAHRLTVSGVTDADTWRALLRVHPVSVSWAASAASARAGDGSRLQPPPASAYLHDRGRELPELGSNETAVGGRLADPG